MAITASTRKSIIDLVVASYNAAPGTSLLSSLVAQSEGGASLADIAATLTASSTFTSIYPSFQTAGEFGTEFLTNLLPGVEAAALAEGVAVVEGLLAAGSTRADVVLIATNYLANLPETDAALGTFAANFNNRVEVATHHTVTLELDSTSQTDLAAVLNGVTADDATVVAAKAAAGTVSNSGETYVLTTGANAITGTSGDDLIVATESTLSSADILNGGGGVDTLRYASSGTAAVNESGFESSSVEIARVTADAVGGTTFDVTGMTGNTSLVNNNSSNALTFTGASAITGLTLTNVSGGNTALTYSAAAGLGGTQTLNLTGNAAISGAAASTVTIGSATLGGAAGLAQVNVVTSGASSSLIDLVTAAPTIMVSGDQKLSITNNLEGATKIDASTSTGGVTVTADSGNLDVVVTGGTGADTANFSNGWDKGDSFDGGEGTDTLGLTYAVANSIVSTNTGTATNVETLDVTDTAAATGTIDMDNFAGVSKVILNGGITTGAVATIDDAVTGITVEVDVDAAATGSLVVDLKTDGATDAITVMLDRLGNTGAAPGGNGGADVIASINVADAETVTITADDDSADGKGAGTISSLTATDATTINISGDADLTITGTADPTTPILATLDASAMTGGLMLNGTNFAKGGSTVTLGSGDDTYNVATSAGADTITLGGGKDTLGYTSVAQSDSDTDTVTDFVSGTDKFAFNFAGAPLVNFVGNKSSFGQSQGAIPGTATPGTGISAVFQIDDQILWIDNNDDGTLDNNDFRIKLTGVTALTAADLGLASTGNTIKLTAAAQTVSGTTTTPGKSTNFADTISSTVAFANGATSLDLGIGTDVLAISDAGAVVPTATWLNIETLTLATVSNTANTVAAFNDASVFANVTGSSNMDTLATTADMREGGSISLGAGNDVITAVALLETAAGADTGVKVNIDMGAGDDTVTTTTLVTFTASTVLNGGTGTDALTLAAGSNTSAGTVTGFETITTGATATMTNAQFTGATTFTNGGTVTLTDAANVTLTATSLGAGDTLTLGNFANTVNLGAAGAGTVTGGTSTDTITGTDTIVAAAAGIDTGTGTDTLTITSFDSNVNITGITTGLENVILQGTGGAGDTFTFDDASMAGAVTVNASGVTGALATVTGELLVATVTSHTITGSAGADTITRTATSTSPGTYNLNNGDSILVDEPLAVSTYNITANATGTTSVTIVDSNAGAFDDVIVLKNAAGTTVSVAGFVVNTAAFSGGGVVSAKATDDGANTVVQVDMNGDGLFGATDVTITLTGVGAAAGDGQALFGIVGGNLSIL